MHQSLRALLPVAAVFAGAACARATQDRASPTINPNGVVGAGDAVDGGPLADAGGLAGDPLPQIPNRGGRILRHPQLVTVTYDGYPLRAGAETFGDFVVRSAWLSSVGAEYGVGQGTHLQTVHLAAPSPAIVTQSQIEALLGSLITSSQVPPENDLILVLYLPAGTGIDQGIGVSCRTFLGYHGELSANGAKFAYAVVATCAGQLAALESTASHELIEAATDPFPLSAPAFALPASDIWALPQGGEVGDLCLGAGDTLESGHRAQRTWSNQAAAAGLAPCVPASAGTVLQGISVVPHGVQSAAPGTQVTYALTGFAAAAAGSWPLRLVPGPGASALSGEATFALSPESLADGTGATLTVDVPSSASPGDLLVLEILSQHPDGTYDFAPIAIEVP